MEELSGQLIDVISFVLGVAAFVVMLLLVYLGIKIVNRIRDEF